MLTPDEKRIRQALDNLSLNNSQATRDALQYLHTLSPDPQGHVVSAVVKALSSDSDIVKKTALNLLGNIGRHHPEVIPNLRAVALDPAQNFDLRGHALQALSSLRTTPAAQCLLEFIAEYIRDGQDALYYLVVENLQKSLIDLIPLQSMIVDIASMHKFSDRLLQELEDLHACITQTGHRCFRGFIDAERRNMQSIPIESWDTSSVISTPQFGDIKVISDGMVPFRRSEITNEFEEYGDGSETNPYEQARAVFLSKGNGEVVLVGVTDIRSSPWLIESGEDFANSSYHLWLSQEVGAGAAQVRVSIFRPPTPLHPAGYFEKADVEDRFDGIDAYQWSGEQELSRWAGRNYEDIKRYLSAGKPLDQDFISYLGGLVEDEVMVARLNNRQNGQDR